MTKSKSTLALELRKTHDWTQAESERVVGDLFNLIADALINGDKVQILGFGTFQVRARKSRKGRNPRTDEEILIPAHKLPAFTAGGSLKRAVNKCQDKTNTRR